MHEAPTLYDSTHDLMVWQRIARKEARDLLLRHRRAGPDVPLVHVPQPGAELLCPACSSEARPDNEDTATCGSCGTLSPLDATVAVANQVHQSLHYAIRVRSALLAGYEDQEVPSSYVPFASLTARVGSIVVLATVAGMRLGQLEELVTTQKPLLQRWLRKEQEQGDTQLAATVPDRATATEIVESTLWSAFLDLRAPFPPRAQVTTTLGRAHAAIAQHHKFRTSSTYLAYLTDALLVEERMRLGLALSQEVPWEELNPLVHALDPGRSAPLTMAQRARAGEEALVDALAHLLRQQVTLVDVAANRHRAVRAMLA